MAVLSIIFSTNDPNPPNSSFSSTRRLVRKMLSAVMLSPSCSPFQCPEAPRSLLALGIIQKQSKGAIQKPDEPSGLGEGQAGGACTPKQPIRAVVRVFSNQGAGQTEPQGRGPNLINLTQSFSQFPPQLPVEGGDEGAGEEAAKHGRVTVGQLGLSSIVNTSHLQCLIPWHALRGSLLLPFF